MKGYKVTAKFNGDTVKFDLPLGVPQETLHEALKSARKLGAEAFGYDYNSMLHPDTLTVTVQEYFD